MKKRTTIALGAVHGVVLATLLVGCAKSQPAKTALPSPAPEAAEFASSPQAAPRSEALLQGGGCRSADRCTEDVCRELQDEVHPTCDVQRSCSGTVTQEEARDRLVINQDCLAARKAVAACFSVQDRGHRQQIESVENAMRTCRGKI